LAAQPFGVLAQVISKAVRRVRRWRVAELNRRKSAVNIGGFCVSNLRDKTAIHSMINSNHGISYCPCNNHRFSVVSCLLIEKQFSKTSPQTNKVLEVKDGSLEFHALIQQIQNCYGDALHC